MKTKFEFVCAGFGIHKGNFVVEKLIVNIGIKAFWYSNAFLFLHKNLFLGIKVELIVEEIVWIWVKDHQGIFLDMLPKKTQSNLGDIFKCFN